MQYWGIYKNGGFIFGVKRSDRLQAKLGEATMD